MAKRRIRGHTGKHEADEGRQRADAQGLHTAEPVADMVAGKAHDRHGGREGGKAETGHCDGCAEFVAQVERAPIEHRAFRHHREQRHQADQPGQRIGRQPQFLLGDIRMRLVGKDHRPGDGQHRKADNVTRMACT
jgi:hypothetical protein